MFSISLRCRLQLFCRLDPIFLEFPEMTGHGRRDYWLALMKEIIAVHHFSRTYKLEGLGKSEALAS
jgi:hypothetical protein